MNQRILWLVVGLMSAALVGLVSIQLYWVRTAVLLKQSQFDSSVQSAMQAVVGRLEAQETRQRVVQLAASEGLDLPVPLTTDAAPGRPSVVRPVLGQATVAAPRTWVPSMRVQVSAPRVELQVRVPEAGAPPAAPPGKPGPGTNCYYVIRDGQVIAVDTLTVQTLTVTATELPPGGTGSAWQRSQSLLNPRGIRAAAGPRAEAQAAASGDPYGAALELARAAEQAEAARNAARWAVMERTLTANPTPEAKAQLRKLHVQMAQEQKRVQKRRQRQNDSIVQALRQHSQQMRMVPLSQRASEGEFLVSTGEGYPIVTWAAAPNAAEANRMAEQEALAQRRRQLALARSHQESQREVKRLNQKIQDLRLAFQDWAVNPPPVPQRADTALLRTMLYQELQARGIHTTLECSLSEGEPNIQLASSATAARRAPSGRTAFATQLFPNDVRPQPYYLVAHFPKQDGYILRSISWILATSGLFICLIVFGFTYTVRTILRQKKLSEMKTDFINNMTHEFKTPIATISLANEALREPHVQQNADKVNRFLRIIQEENKRMEGQVVRVLQMAEIERGNLHLSMQPVDAHDILRDALSKIALQVEKRGGTIQLNLQATRTRMEADSLHLCNIFYNLLDNANKYSPEAPLIHVSTHNIGSLLRVTVADRGIGMTDSQLKRIFESFYRVSTGNRHDVKGFGLGLAYVKSMVQAHGGTIEVRSEPGKGSKFEICFPLSTPTP